MPLSALDEMRARVEHLDQALPARERAVREAEDNLAHARRQLAEVLDLRDQYDTVIHQAEQDAMWRPVPQAPQVLPMSRSGGRGDVLYGAA